MKTMNGKLLLTGMLAGITAVLLVLGASAQPTLSSILYAASALPVLIVGLGWGNMAAVTAIVTAAAVGAVTVSPMFALAMAIFTLLPAGWISHLANLARPASELGGPDDLMAWYPLSDILLHLCGIVSLAVIALGVMIGYSPELVSQMVDMIITSTTTADPSLSMDAGQIMQVEGMMLMALPIVQAGMWVMMLTAAFYIASRIVAASGHALRPREDIPSAMRMNRNALFIFLAGIVACFVGGTAALIGATICGAFGAGFVMAGFASMHARTRGKDWRTPVLIIAYLSLLMFFPLFLFLVIGLADTGRTVALTPNGKSGKDQPKP